MLVHCLSARFEEASFVDWWSLVIRNYKTRDTHPSYPSSPGKRPRFSDQSQPKQLSRTWRTFEHWMSMKWPRRLPESRLESNRGRRLPEGHKGCHFHGLRNRVGNCIVNEWEVLSCREDFEPGMHSSCLDS